MAPRTLQTSFQGVLGFLPVSFPTVSHDGQCPCVPTYFHPCGSYHLPEEMTSGRAWKWGLPPAHPLLLQPAWELVLSLTESSRIKPWHSHLETV